MKRRTESGLPVRSFIPREARRNGGIGELEPREAHNLKVVGSSPAPTPACVGGFSAVSACSERTANAGHLYRVASPASVAPAIRGKLFRRNHVRFHADTAIEEGKVMREEVHTIEEAANWFLENHAGGIMCCKDDGTEKMCYSYSEAAGFYGHIG